MKVPPGFAPEHIRKQWVGVEIRLPTQEEISIDPPSNMGIGNQNAGGYDVFGHDAVEALKSAGRYEAAEFWEGLVLGRYLRFKKEVCEVLE